MVDIDKLQSVDDKILNCPFINSDDGCKDELTDVSNFKYKHGPEISFIGSKYGKYNPKILFTRLNPPWPKDYGLYGTKESIDGYLLENPGSSLLEIHSRIKTWISSDGRIFRGLEEAGTITGHPNRSKKPAADKIVHPRYGIQVILQEMIKKNIFPSPDESPLELFAVNNVIKCSGKFKLSNPKSKMKNNCQYYRDELEILNPDVLFIVGKKAYDLLTNKGRNISSEINNEWFFLEFTTRRLFCIHIPHPNLRGSYSQWAKFRKNKDHFQNNYYSQEFDNSGELDSGSYIFQNKYLYNYVLNSVWKIQQLKEKGIVK